MSSIVIQWIPVILCLLLFVAVVVWEALWLVKKGWATAGRAVAFVLTTDLLGFGIGVLVIVSVFMALMMMVFGPAGTGSTAPDAAYVAVLVLGLIVPPIFLFLSQRLLLSIFSIQAGKAAWLYSLASSALIVLVVFIPPPAVFYVLGTVFSWK